MRGLKHRVPTLAARGRSRGISIVELMVGVAIGLVVVAAASFVAVNQLGDNRRLLLETQIQQDLRASADLIARDLRRAGFWAEAEKGVWYDGGPNAAANPYSDTAPAADDASEIEVTYVYSRGAEDGAIDDDTERFGFKLEDYTVKMLVGGAWQALTDSNVLKVTKFEVELDRKAAGLSCFKECAGGGTACWPAQDVRRFSVLIEAEARADSSVKRSVRSNLRLRNDATSGACPA